MVGRKRGDNPGYLARGRERFEAWRRSRKVGARIPEKLWSLAVMLAEAHGLGRTASALKLDYHSLKNRVSGRNCDSSSVAPAFIELSPPPLAPSKAKPCEKQNRKQNRAIHLLDGSLLCC